MNESCEIISIWRNVFVKISSSNTANGTFQMSRCGLSILFTWTPTCTNNNNICDIDPGHIAFAIELNQIDSISIDKSNIDHGILELFLKDYSKFPKIIFTQHGNLAVSHLVNYLVDQKLATFFHKTSPNIQITSASSQIRCFPCNCANLVRYKILVSHWVALDLLGVHEIIETKPILDFSSIQNFTDDEFKQKCFNSRLDDNIRYKVWPRLLKTFINDDYCTTIWSKLTRRQLIEVEPIIEKVNQNTEWLSTSNNCTKLNQLFIREVLQTLALYHPNLAYDCLGEVLFLFIKIFIKSFPEQDSNVDKEIKQIEMKDGRVISYIEARQFIFSHFTSFISRAHLDYLFLSHRKNYKSYSEKIYSIILAINNCISEKLIVYELKDFAFIYGSIYSMYSKDFDEDSVLRLWDAIISYQDEKVDFLLFFNAAVTIMLFTPMFMQKIKDKGKIIEVAQETLKRLDIDTLIRMTSKLIEIIKAKKDMEWIFVNPVDDKNYLDYTPKYLKLVK